MTRPRNISDSAPGTETSSRLINCAIIVLVLILVLPDQCYKIELGGEDDPWAIGLLYSLRLGYVIGRDVILTYGPLGITALRSPFKDVIPCLLIADIITYSTVVALAILALRRVSGWNERLLWFFAIACFGSLQELRERVVFLFAALLFFLLREGHAKHLMWAGVLSIFLLLSKVNFGFLAFFLFLAKVILDLAHGRRSSLVPLVFFTLVTAAALTAFQIDLISYARASASFAGDYSDAMSLRAPLPLQLIALFEGVILIVLCTLLRKGPLTFAESVFQLGAFVLAFVIIYKQGFIRGDHSHYIQFFRFLPLLLLTMMSSFEASDPERAKRLLWLSVFPCVLMTASSPVDPRAHSPRLPVWGYIEDLLYPPRITWKDPNPVPNELIEIIGNSTVTILPTENLQAYQYGFNLRPLPVFASYAAFNSFLDSKNSARLSGPDAPSFILYGVGPANGTIGTIDGRYGFADESYTKLAIFTHYEIAGTSDRYLVLRRRDKPVSGLRLAASFTEQAVLGKPGEIIQDDRSLCYMKAYIEYSFLGRLYKAFIGAPELFMELWIDDGTTRSFQAIRPILAGGIYIQHAVETLSDHSAFFGRNFRALRKVKALTLRSSQMWAFKKNISVDTDCYSLSPE